ncbi:ndor1 [Symbiodinium sp. CCMP2456]|nr:ndor1 [Symbiodinium sp. CCMP2456]
MAAVWEVVGGADKGGILVRESSDLSSAILDSRLATGAKVKEVQWQDGRLGYELVSGTGPAKGWVTVNLKGKDLLVQLEKELAESTSEGEIQVEASSESDVASPTGKVNEKEPSNDEKEALKQYLDKFGENRTGSNPGFNRKAFPWAVNHAAKRTTPKEAIEAALMAPKPKKERKSAPTDVDSEGEEVPLCCRCLMPVGEFAYEGREGRGSCVHAECMAQVLVDDAQRQEDRRMGWEAEKKLKSRKEYEIGWVMDSVPKNTTWAERMGCSATPQGLCCLVFDEVTRTVKVAPTLEPAAAVNLEYLLLALKVRKTASREPLFSLDPVDPQNLEKTPQKKVYEPSWLAGTSVGDVMFQADYFLKELALGEYEMPVSGMLSVFDWSELSDKDRDKAWAGREWYVVKKAEVRLAQDKTLVPFVKMGVEAREQVVTKKGLEDAAVTASTHPLKKFADAFTRNFDLIAERKSVVYHVRELAKASVLAKYLVDSHTRLDPSWYRLADEIVKSTPKEAHPEIPQLWNMRGNSRIQLKNGRLIDMFTGGQRNLQAIYGGVEFGLDRFELAQRHALQGQTGMQLGQSGRPMFMPQRFQLGQRAEMPQGVDLNLDKFDLTKPERFAGSLPPCSGGPDSLEAKVTLGRAFLRSLREQDFDDLKTEYKELLVKVFGSPQCDRTGEGDSFIPPDPNMEYAAKLRSLIHEEKSLLERRKLHFFDRSFKAGNPGTDFPRSWTSRFQIEKDGVAPKFEVSNKSGLSKVEFDDSFRKVLVSDILPTAAPEFKQITEDGTVFRIYHIGSLEVRTTEEKFGKEQVGVLFSTSAPTWNLASKDRSQSISDGEKIQNCKVYLEAAEGEAHASKQPHHFYMVCQTASKNLIVTEKLATGATTCVVNPANLETTVRSLKTLQSNMDRSVPGGASLSARKQYVKAAFKQTTGKSFHGKWGGFIRRYSGPGVFLGRTPLMVPMDRSSGLMNGTWTAKKKFDLLQMKANK